MIPRILDHSAMPRSRCFAAVCCQIVVTDDRARLAGMYELDGVKWFDYVSAARRVHRTDRTIKRWRREGMPMSWRNGMRIVREDVLLATYRQRLKNSPVHQYRLRALRRAELSTS